uniref:Uncharacterized protein n=1 Tax=Anopheles minimus TaxID=112268 RepID=A0A182WBD0_9DIPT
MWSSVKASATRCPTKRRTYCICFSVAIWRLSCGSVPRQGAVSLLILCFTGVVSTKKPDRGLLEILLQKINTSALLMAIC